MMRIQQYRKQFNEMRPLKRLGVLLALGAFVFQTVALLVMGSTFFEDTIINGERFNTGLLVIGFLVAASVFPVDISYVLSQTFYLSLIVVVAVALGAATTSLLIAGQAVAAVGAGVAFGAVLSYVISEYARAWFGLVDELIKLGWRASFALVDRVDAYLKVRFQQAKEQVS